jgi:hypothetical protein
LAPQRVNKLWDTGKEVRQANKVATSGVDDLHDALRDFVRLISSADLDEEGACLAGAAIAAALWLLQRHGELSELLRCKAGQPRAALQLGDFLAALIKLLAGDNNLSSAGRLACEVALDELRSTAAALERDIGAKNSMKVMGQPREPL